MGGGRLHGDGRLLVRLHCTVTHSPGGLIVDIVTSDEGLDEHSGQYMNLVSTVC